MATIPEKYLDLLEQKKAFAVLATTMSDGSPQVTPVWFDYKDGLVRVNTAKGRVKARNLKKGAAVAVSFLHPRKAPPHIPNPGRGGRGTRDGAQARTHTPSQKNHAQGKKRHTPPPPR